jgi:hypothetical protein
MLNIQLTVTSEFQHFLIYTKVTQMTEVSRLTVTEAGS